mgnify:CR=1 FL=1
MKRRSDEEISAPLYAFDAEVRSQYGCFAGVGEAGRNCACHRVASNLFEVEHRGASNIDGCQFTVVNHAVHMRRGDAEAIRCQFPGH